MADPLKIAHQLGDVADMARVMLGEGVVAIVVIAQVEMGDDRVNLAATWPLDNQREASEMAAEAAEVLRHE